jgi:hypothetical protein
MTQDEVIDMAIQAGASPDERLWLMYAEELEAFAKLVSAKAFQDGYEKGIAAFNEAVLIEREACAKVCDELIGSDRDDGIDDESYEGYDDGWLDACNTIKFFVKKRGES